MLPAPRRRYHTLVSHFKELECHRLAVEPLLYKYGVNIALHGHVHAYERSAKWVTGTAAAAAAAAVWRPLGHPL